MIADDAILALSYALGTSGFTVLRDYIDDIKDVDPHFDGMAAFLRVKKTELSELTADSYGTPCCRAEITFAIRALGAAAGFYDAELLAERTDEAISNFFFDSEMIVKSITCGDIKNNALLGRLEQPLEITVVTTARKEE